MAENVRLVIWDLDDTFWKGVFTEGGIEYQQSAHDIVIELARRGIMSSICSKNEHETVKRILVEKEIWDYFVFPSINWDSKGQRVAGIIEDAELRPATVLFIDDNAMNRAEAVRLVPGLQVADETMVPSLLHDIRLQGKDDAGLTRLSQYKLLERRRGEQRRHGDNLDFLRSSEIEASFDFEIEGDIDRAIELINRTNQLNFTKRRLPEQPEAARSELRRQLGERNVQAALVRVRDKYGDYGFTGFYLLHLHDRHLVHFCFSCRTIGMGVERWLYRELGSPKLSIAPEVVVDIDAKEPAIDWVNNGARGKGEAQSKPIRRAIVRGGCEMQAIAHYLSFAVEKLEMEFAISRSDVPVQIHHSVFTRAAFEGISELQLAAARMLGYERGDFESAAARESFDLVVFSFWADAHNVLYRDRETGVVLPFTLNGRNSGVDIRQADPEELRPFLTDPGMESKIEALRARFDCLTWSLELGVGNGETLLGRTLRIVFDATSPPAMIFILLGCEKVYDANGDPSPVHHLIALNRVIRLAAKGRSRVKLLAIEDFISEPSEVIDATHFDRRVYFRIYERIAGELRADGGATGAPHPLGSLGSSEESRRELSETFIV